MLRVTTVVALLFATSCAQPHLGWDGANPEDPAPSGPDYLRAYKESHYRDVGQRFTDSLGWDALFEELDGRAVLFLGDHHEDEQLHERMLSLLLRLVKSREVVFGLEAIGAEDEPSLEQFLGGELDLDMLRAQVAQRWRGSWLDSDEVDKRFYRMLLVLAHDHGVPVFALEPTPRLPLEQRDPVIAERIRQAAQTHPDRLVVVIVGHAHLLGEDKLVELTRLPCAAFGARMSRSLRSEFADGTFRKPFLRSDAGVLFFNPTPGIL